MSAPPPYGLASGQTTTIPPKAPGETSGEGMLDIDDAETVREICDLWTARKLPTRPDPKGAAQRPLPRFLAQTGRITLDHGPAAEAGSARRGGVVERSGLLLDERSFVSTTCAHSGRASVNCRRGHPAGACPHATSRTATDKPRRSPRGRRHASDWVRRSHQGFGR